MKRNLLYTLIFLFVSNFAFTQIEINPSALEFDAKGSEVELYQEFYITNNTGSDLEVYWKFDLPESFPDEWITQICDINLCYGWGVLESSSSASAANMIPDGAEVKFSVKVKRSDVDEGVMQGTSYGIIRLYDDGDKTNEIAASNSPSTSTNDLDLASIVIFPNPTTDLIQIKNDANISNVSIYNVVGRQVSSLSHRAGEAHDVSALRTGMYVVRLENNKGEVVKAMRLSKR